MKNLPVIDAQVASDDMPFPRAGRYSLRERRSSNGQPIWWLYFQPQGVRSTPQNVTIMEMREGEIMPSGKRRELAMKLIECGLPWCLEYTDVRLATAAYVHIAGVHDAAGSAQ